MGCCSSNPRAVTTPRDFLPRLAEKRVLPKQESSSGLQARISTASWVSSLPFRGTSVISQSDYGIFAAVFVGVGGTEAADFCRSNVQQEFDVQCMTEGKDRIVAMQKVLHSLHARFLAEDTIPKQVRASVGASGALLFLELATDTLHVASVGDCGCVLGSLDHGLATQRSQGSLLMRGTECMQLNQEALLIGFGAAKVPSAGRQLKGALDPLLQPTCHVQVATRRLTALDEHILLGTDTFWRFVSPDDAALRSHLHLKAHSAIKIGSTYAAPPFLAPLKNSLAAGRYGAQADVPNTAEHMVLWAMMKAASAVGRKLGRKVSVESLNTVPVQPPIKRKRGVLECCFSSPQTLEEAAVPPPRGSLGDVGLVAVALKWPTASLNQAFIDELRAGGDGLKALQALNTPQLRARYRWRQVRTLCVEFVRQRRRLLLQKWWQVVDAEVKSAKKRAQKLEELIWREQGIAIEASPTLKIKARPGAVIQEADVARAMALMKM